jgi:hypothetical protein
MNRQPPYGEHVPYLPPRNVLDSCMSQALGTATSTHRCVRLVQAIQNCSIKYLILHQFWVKTISPWKINLEYGGIFTKLFMHVTSRNMFPTTIRVHVYRPRHCCGDWLTFGCFVLMNADHDPWRKVKQSWMLRKHAHIPDNDYWGICLFHVMWTNFFWRRFGSRYVEAAYDTNDMMLNFF